MPTAWTRLLDLKPSTFHANVKLRLIRAYDLNSFRNAGEVYARECVFHDNEVQVVDDIGNVSLVLWDKHCLKILGKKSEELVKKNENPGELPFEIEEMVEKRYMFEVEVSKSQASLYEDTFSVIQVSTDPTFIEKYSLDTPNTQESVTQAKNMSVLMGKSHFQSTTEKGDVEICSTSDLHEQSSGNRGEKMGLKRDLMDDFGCVEGGDAKRGKRPMKLE